MSDEIYRLRLLHELALLDTAPEPAYDDLARLAARLCGTPSAALTLVDERRTWPKAWFGSPMPEAPREVSFCAHALRSDDLFVVEDARHDERFCTSPLVAHAPHIVFYACMPLTLSQGERVGALSVFDFVPRRLDADAADMLRTLSRQAASLLEQRLACRRLEQTTQRLAELQALSHIGAWELDIDSGALQWSDEVFRIFGMPPRAFTPTTQTFERHLHPEDRQAVLEALARLDAGLAPPDKVFRIVRADGAVRHVHGRAVRVHRPGPLGDHVMGTLQDVTQEQEATSALQARTGELELTANRLRLACRLGQISAWDYDTEQRTLRWDKALFQVFGFDPRHQPTVEQVFERFSSPGRELLMSAFEACCSQGVPYDMVQQITSTRGQKRWTRSIGEAARAADGRIVRVQGAFQDITQQMRSVEQSLRVGRQLETTLECMSDAFYLLDRQWRLVYFNAEAERLLKRSRAEVLEHPIWEVFPALVGSELEQSYRDAVACGCTARLEYCYPPNRRWYDITAHPSDEGLAVYFRDITEQRAKVETWRLLAEAMPLIVWTARTNGDTDYVSPALARYAGVPAEVLAPNAWLALAHPEDRAGVAEAWRQARRTCLPYQAEVRLRRADGVYRWHLTRAVLVATDDSGEQTWYGSTIDIDDNKRLEQEAHALAQRLSATMESITDAIFTLDRQWRFTFLNHQAEVQLRRSRNELLGRNVWEMFPEAGGSAFQGNYELCMATGTVVRFESFYAPLDKHLEVTAYPSDGGISVYFRDVTQRKQAEQDRAAREAAEEANRAKSQFLARISHELRTPLNAILGFAQMMELDTVAPLDAVQTERLHKVHGAARHLLAMINEMLDLAGIESGGVSLKLGAVTLQPVAVGCVEGVEPQARAAQVQVTNDIGPDAPAVLADAMRLRQLLLNLLSNAVKYNRRGGWVRLSAHVSAQQVAINVEDTGQGLDDDQMAQLFQPFNRLGAERSDIEGTGLGLVIAKKLAQLMQGDLRAARRQEGGSVFTLELPVAQPADDTRVTEESVPLSNSAVEAASGPEGTVLYIEDEPVNALLVQHIMALRPRCTLHLADNGERGIAQAQELQPGLVLIDLNLPDMSGYEVLRRLRQNATTRHLRCIALSADAMPDSIERARVAGFDDFWTKPIEVQAFLRGLDAQLKRA